MNTGTSASTAYALRKQYIKHLLPFECKFDRGGIDPVPLIAQLESSSRKKKAQAAQAPGIYKKFLCLCCLARMLVIVQYYVK